MATATSNTVSFGSGTSGYLVMDYSAGGGYFTLNSISGYYSYSGTSAWDATSNYTHSISFPGGSGSFTTLAGSSSSGNGFGFGRGYSAWVWNISGVPLTWGGAGSGNVSITTTSATGVSDIRSRTFTFTGINVGYAVYTPVINTPTVSNIGRTTANSSFTVANDGGAPIVDHWLDCGATNFGNVVSTIQGSSGTFSGLTPNKTYFIRANASNGTYRGYSAIRQFKTTHNNPSIGDRTITHVSNESALNSKYTTTIAYSTTYDYANYGRHSLVYGTTTSYGSTATSTGTAGSSSFILNNLKHNTTYYYKITETDDTGQSSTATGSFTTPTRVKVVTTDGVTPASVSVITYNV